MEIFDTGATLPPTPVAAAAADTIGRTFGEVAESGRTRLPAKEVTAARWSVGSNPTLSAEATAALCSTLADLRPRWADDDDPRSCRQRPCQQSVGHGIIPAPRSYAVVPDETFELTPTTRIVVVSDDPVAAAVAERFAAWLRRPTGLPLPVGGDASEGDIVLTVAPSDELGAEGYTLRVESSGVQHRRRHTSRPVPGADDAAPDAPALSRGDRRAARAVDGHRRRDRRPAALRVPRHDARRRPPLLRASTTCSATST